MLREHFDPVHLVSADLNRPYPRRRAVRLFGASLAGAMGLGSLAPLPSAAKRKAARAPMKRRRRRRRKGRRGTGAGGGSGPGTQGPSRTTVIQTFTSTGNLVIPTSGHANPWPARLEVSGLAGGILENLTLTLHGLTHTYPQDIYVLLGSPDPAPLVVSLVVMAGVGGDIDVNGIDVTFDDEASAFLTDVTPLLPGTYQPSIGTGDITGDPPRLALFNGLDPNGTWTLYVRDDRAQDGGRLTGWSLRITASVPI